MTPRSSPTNPFISQVRIVAVSKLKPASDILALHESSARQINFGENYLQELTEKAHVLPLSIRWHFIGALQTNKCARLAQIPNLFVVSSVDAQKKADALNKARGQFIASRREAFVGGERESENGRNGRDKDLVQGKDQAQETAPEEQEDEGDGDKLGIHIQINTSNEDSKSGVPPSEAASLCKHVLQSCPHLRLRGLMTIGALARSQATSSSANPDNPSSTADDKNSDNNSSTAENPDFVTLRQTRDQVVKELGLADDVTLELSMGMSQDYEHAIRAGTDEVRVGSTIFGERPPKKDGEVKGEVVQGGG